MVVMGLSEEMNKPLSRKRSAENSDKKGKKAKRKKTTSENVMDVHSAVLTGEIPSLFHMQIGELLKEARMKTLRQEKLTEAVEKLKYILLNMSPGKERKIHAQKWMKNVHLPVVQEPKTTKGYFQFRAPTRVSLGGSLPLNTCMQPSQAADLILEMPKECFQGKDCFNHRYIRKRALYLAAVAVRLSKSKAVKHIRFTYHQGNVYKPILVLTVPGKGKPLTIHLHAIPEEGVFKPSRFHITKNNVRPRWFYGQEREEEVAGNDDTDSLPRTPVYNTSILQDICYSANAEFLSQHLQGAESVQDAIALLKIWMHQRELDVDSIRILMGQFRTRMHFDMAPKAACAEIDGCVTIDPSDIWPSLVLTGVVGRGVKGYGCFSGFLMSMYVCHLLSKGLVLHSMNSFQIFRQILLKLSHSKWLEDPVILCPEAGEGNRPSLDQFLQVFDMVFIDVTGYLNLSLGMTKSLYSRVCHEASIAVENLTDEASENFNHLFMTPCSFQLKFDCIFTVTFTPEALKKVVEKFQLSEHALDHNNNLVTTVMPSILEVLEQGLGDRVTLIQPQPQQTLAWSVTENPPPSVSDCTLTFGLLHHKSNSLQLLDRGPPANTPEAADFRQFWGEKSELRRFKDGSISESVVWAFSSGLNRKRSICQQIVQHILNRHADIQSHQIHSVGQVVETVLHVPRQVILETERKDRQKAESDGETYGTGEERIYLIRQVLEELGKTLRNLPNLALRINAVTGIDPVFRFTEVFPAHPAIPKLTSENMLKGGKSLPIYTPAMTVICTLEGSGHWPEDINRIRDLKTLYLIDLGNKLAGCGFTVNIQETYVDVLKDGFVFRLKLGVSREIGVLRMVHSLEGMLRMTDTPESMAVEAEITVLPELTTVLQGVQQENPVFCSTVRLVKRWLSSQMLLAPIPEVTMERTVAHIFKNPLPFTSPVSPLVGLYRFLKLVSGDEYKVENFGDKVTSPPPVVIMNWLRTVAAESLRVLQAMPESERMVIFRPPLDVYDLVIHLSSQCQTRRHQGVGVKNLSLTAYRNASHGNKTAFREIKMPVMAFNPAEIFLETLKEVFGEFALFFHDQYGGNVIAVLLKPEIFEAKPVQIANLFGRKPTISGSEPSLTFDLEAMVESVYSMGQDVVTNVEVVKKRKNRQS